MVNQSVAWAEWDEEKLAQELQELRDSDFDLTLNHALRCSHSCSIPKRASARGTGAISYSNYRYLPMSLLGLLGRQHPGKLKESGVDVAI
jgi:hypothetical protein